MYSRVGVPEEVLRVLGMQFTSDCIKEVSRFLSIRRLTTSPYHFACNRLVVKFSGTLKQMSRRLCHEQQRQWHRFSNPLLFAYRKARREATGFSPFELLHGRTVRDPVQILKELWSEEQGFLQVTMSYQYFLELRDRLDEAIKLAQTELKRNQICNKKLDNQKAKNKVFQVGDKVLMLLPTDHNKLLMQWKGTFEVKVCKGGNNYQIDICRKTKTFHINLLKQYVETDNVEMTASPERRDFPRETREETRGVLGSRSSVFRGADPRRQQSMG